MKMLIEIKADNLAKNDILIFNGKEFEPLDKNALMSELWLKIKELEEIIETNKVDNVKALENLKNGVNSKLEEHHKILQILVKEQ